MGKKSNIREVILQEWVALTRSKLQEGDLELIEVLKVHPPWISLSEIIQELQAPEISMSAISRAIKNRLPSCEQYVYKEKKT